MKTTSTLIFAGVLVVLLALLVIRNQQSISPSKKDNSIATTQTTESDKSQVVSSRDELPRRMSPEQVKAWEQQDLAERQLDLQNFVLPKEGSDSVLNIELRIKPGCFPGDADAIAMDLKAASDHQLLGTLEGMSRGTVAMSWVVPKDLFSSGVAKTKFKIKASKDPIQLGFYLCTSKRGDSCQGKKVRDVNEIFAEHLTKKTDAGKEERMIFYQYFILDDQGLRAFSGNPSGKDHFEQLKKYAAERKFQGQNVNEGIDHAQEALETLVSLPVTYEKETLIVSLPKYDDVVCANIDKTLQKVGPMQPPIEEKK